jgi:hypothetical protein
LGLALDLDLGLGLGLATLPDLVAFFFTCYYNFFWFLLVTEKIRSLGSGSGGGAVLYA